MYGVCVWAFKKLRYIGCVGPLPYADLVLILDGHWAERLWTVVGLDSRVHLQYDL